MTLLRHSSFPMLLLAVVFTLTASPPGQGEEAVLPTATMSPKLPDQGVFRILLAGRRIGSEKFQIQSTVDQITCQAESQLEIEHEGKTVTTKTTCSLILNSQLVPLNYTWSLRGDQTSSLEADFRSSPAKLRYRTITGETDERDFILPPDVVLIDNNVFSHFALLAARFLLTAGGTQGFKAFVPQDALPGELTVENKGEEAVTIQGRPHSLQHLVVTTELAQIDLWLDDQQHLQRVLIAASQLEAVRER